MSEIKQRADVEAAAAEADLNEAELERAQAVVAEGVPIDEAIATILSEREPEPAPPAEPPPPVPATGEPTKKQLQQLDAEQTRHEKRIHEIMGGFVAGFTACDQCGGVGLVPPGAPPPQAQHHDWFRACETCAGFGVVLTGSTRPGYESRDCPACKGRGYLEALDRDGQPLAREGGQPEPANAHEPAGLNGQNAEEANGVASFGTPTWMGDPSLSRP